MKFILLAVSLAFTLFPAGAVTFQTENIHMEGSKGKLFGILEYPAQVKSDVKYPLVILCHGFGGNCESPLEKTLASDLAANGIASLRFDFNGHGKSEGEFKDMTVPNEIQDLKNVISWAQSLPWVESIALEGHSQGGVVVSMTAGELGEGVIKAEALMAPAAVLKDDAIRGNTMGARYNPWDLAGDYVQLPSFGDSPGLQLGKNYVESALSLPIYETARKYSGPALILQGTHDFIVPFTYAERYDYELPNSELILIDGDNHGFTESIIKTCKFMADWFKAILKPSIVEPVKI